MKFVVPRSGGIFEFAKDRLRAGLQTSQDRGARRLGRARLTGIATLLARGIAVCVGLLTLPLTSHYLGKERFGVWLILSSLIAWFAIADFGLSNGLINALAAADGKQDTRDARNSVASAFWTLVSLSIAIILLGLLIAPLISWARIFNLATPLAVAEINSAVIVVIIFCSLRLPGSVISSVYQAYQEGYIYQIWNGIGGLLAAIGLVAAIRSEAGLPWLAGAFLGGMLFADFLSAIYLFGWHRKWLLPRPRFYEWSKANTLLKFGGQFWIAQMSSVLLFQTDLIIVSRLFGAGEAASYGTTLRLFALIGAVQTAFLLPFWAAYGEAMARGDLEWLSRVFNRSIQVSLVWSIAVSILMFALMPWLFRLLVTSDVVSDPHLRLAMMVTEIINSVTRCIAVFLNGLGAIRSQVIFGPVCAAANLALSVVLGYIVGAPGVAWATAICLMIFWLGFIGRSARGQLEASK